MADTALTDFVKDALGRGLTRQQIQDALRQAGWNDDQVAAALLGFASVDFPIPVPRPQPSLSALDAFTYLLLFTTLHIAAFNLGFLLFEVIDRMIPDPGASGSVVPLARAVRFPLSALIVATPVWLFMSRVTSRALARDSARRHSPVRRWLTYLTLFVAACIVIGDVTSLVYSLLGGELRLRFALKALTVGTIAGAVFWYYLPDMRRDEAPATVG